MNNIGYFTYLKFYPDGGLYTFGGKAMQPDTVAKYGYVSTVRKVRNGIPKDRKASWDIIVSWAIWWNSHTERALLWGLHKLGKKCGL